MLKYEVLQILTVLEWVAFKEYSARQTQRKVSLSDGREMIDYDEHDLQKFLEVARPGGDDGPAKMG